MNPRHTQKMAVTVLWALAFLAVAILFFIVAFILRHGLGVLSPEFILGSPERMGKAGGIFPTIVGTFYLTLVAVLVATPLGVGTAIYLTEYARENWATRLIRFGANTLAAMPSIIFGLFGFVLFVITLGFGWSILSGGLTLAFMILPTIIRTAEEAIRTVPASYREVSFALGGSKWQTVTRAVLPNALPGIFTGVILGIGRSIEETACIIFTAGTALRLPHSIFDPVRTMSVHFYILAREGISMRNAYGTAAILIISVLTVNAISYWLMRRFMARFS